MKKIMPHLKALNDIAINSYHNAAPLVLKPKENKSIVDAILW
jgi:hypothetical protein